MRSLKVTWLVLVMLLLSATAVMAGHPAQGHPIDGFWVEGSSFPPAELSRGDLTFMALEDYPDYGAISQLEQYMMFGVKTSELSAESGLPPYVTTIFSLMCKFHKAHGYVPNRLTPDVIRMIPGKEDTPDEWLSIERNPLTGEWPELKAAEHAPGDFYIRALTDEEIDYFAENGYGYLRSPSGGNAKRTTPVFYIRMYGEDGVLLNGFKFLAKAN